jgi:hypothetical protein
MSFARLAARSLTAIALFAAIASSAAAAVINFANLPPFANYADIPVGYGSTAQVAVSYRSFNNDAGYTTSANNVELWNAGYSNLPAAVFAQTNGLGAEIRLIPVAGFAVSLQSFLLGSYQADAQGVGPNRTAVLLRVIDTGTGSVLWNDNGRVINSTQNLFPNVASSNGLAVQWGFDWNIGLNNLTFDARSTGPGTTVIPLPPALALFLAGAGLLGWSSRKRAA